MKFFCFLVFLITALPVTAAEPVNRQSQGNEPPRQTQPVAEKEQVVKPQQKGPALKSFTPSEKINADAVVAFPVDI